MRSPAEDLSKVTEKKKNVTLRSGKNYKQKQGMLYGGTFAVALLFVLGQPFNETDVSLLPPYSIKKGAEGLYLAKQLDLLSRRNCMRRHDFCALLKGTIQGELPQA